MEWLTSIRKAIEFMEEHLTEDISVQDVSNCVSISPMFLQKGFSVMTGLGISEYMRNRRLYEAALELKKGDDKIIDIALKYAYETPESFTKAFTRFHGATPTEIRYNGAPFKPFLPMKISISITGGNEMNYKIKTLEGFKVIGFERRFSLTDTEEKIPMFWDEMFNTYAKRIVMGNKPENPIEHAIIDNHIGDYGICIDGEELDSLRYMIAGEYLGGPVPEGMTLYEFPKGEWAVFEAVGPMPDAIQKLSDQIYGEWLPGNPYYELNGNANVEWYDSSMPDKTVEDYRSAVWIPVKAKK